MSVFDKVKDIIIEELDADAAAITMESSLVDDLGADSLDALELIMSLQDEFDVEIDDEFAQGVKTVGEIVKYIEENK